MKVNNVGQWAYNKDIQRKEVNGKKQKKTGNSDKLEISSEARSLQKNTSLQITGTNSLKELEEVRNHKVEEAKVKLKEGFYFSNDISKQIVENILKNLGV